MKRNLTDLSDQELLEEARKIKTGSIINAVLIGFLIGVIFYSICNNSWGFLMLLPLFLIYKLTRKSYRSEELKSILKERNLDSSI